MKKKLILASVAVAVVLLMIASAAKTLKLLIWLLAAVGLYAIYITVTNKVKTTKRKTQ